MTEIRERRRNIRYECAGIADIAMAGDLPAIRGTMIELSRAGCLLAVQDAECVGKEAHVELTCQIGYRSFRIQGRAQSVRSASRVGIRFEGVDATGVEQLESLLSELAARRHEYSAQTRMVPTKEKPQA